MASILEKNRVHAITDALEKALTGEPAIRLNVSPENDEIDRLAGAVNNLLAKNEKPVSPVNDNMTQGLSQAGEERYRHILDRMQESYFEADLQGNITFFNDRVPKELGYPAQKIRHLNFQELVDQENSKIVYERFHQIFLTGQAIRAFEWQIRKKDGQIIDVESSIGLLRDEQGRPSGFHGVVRDITTRKQAERELRQSEERYRHILDSIEESYFEVDLKGNLTFFNDTVVRNLNYTPAEIRNVNFRQLVNEQNAKKVYEAFHRGYVTGETIKGFDWKIIKKDGGTIDVESSVALLHDEQSRPCGFRGIVRDISQRKQTENIYEFIWTRDFDLNYTYVSPSVFHVTGFTPAEIMNMPIKGFLPVAQYDTIVQTVTDRLKEANAGFREDERQPAVFEMELIRKDGTHFWAEVSAYFNRDENGKPFEIIGITRDVSERKKAEKDFQESEKRYRMIVENIHDVVFVVDLNFQITFVSTHRSLLTGYTPDEINKVPVDKLLTPPSLELALNLFADAMEREKRGEANPAGRSTTVELEVYHKNGGTVWLELTAAFSRDEHGVAREIIAATRDITARKKIELALEESEKRYRMIVENMNESIVLLDLNLQYLYQSPSEIRITGYTPEEIMKIPLERQLTPESYARGVAMLSEELEKEFGGKPVDPKRSRTIEVEFYRKNSGTVWLEMTASFQRDETGKPVGILLSGRNINERKKAEAEREKLEEQLHQAQKMETVGRLAGGVAHDFNNMLSIILGYIELAKLKLTANHPVLPDILEIEKAAGHSRDLTAQLLAFSRKQIINPRAIDLNRLIAETQKTIVRVIGENIDLTFHPGRDLWSIKFDPLQIEQILINLALNARDAMPQGGKLMMETTNTNIDHQTGGEVHPDLVPGPYVLLTISDTGAGIEKDHMPYIFEPFFTTKEVGKGTGLGLATVYGIVKQNNGTISVYSEPRRGSTFKIYLPRTGNGEEIRKTTPAQPASPVSGTILVVEDDEMVLHMVTDMLEALGYSVIASNNPQEALSLCEAGTAPIDLVITDVVMPALSGRELRDKLAVSRPGLKVLFMSGYTSPIMAQHGILEEGVQFIQKPFSMSILAAKVSHLIAAS